MSVCIDDDVERARDAMRHLIALYVGGMGSRDKNFYNALVRRYGFEEAAQTVQDLYLDGKKDEAAAALPPELIDNVAIVGPRDKVRDRLAVYRGRRRRHPDPLDRGSRRGQPQADGPRPGGDALSEPARGRRLLIAAFGDPGHAFPAIALGRELVARGHEVWLETWEAGASTWSGRACASPRRPSTTCSEGRPPLGIYRRPCGPAPATRALIQGSTPTRWWWTS